MSTELTNNQEQQNSQQPPAGGQQQTPPPSGGGQTSWRDSLPDELKSEPSLASFSDVTNLAKSYVNAQKMIGKKGVVVPGEKASDEEWDNFYKQIGRPELDKYELEAPEGANAETIKAFKETAHKLGIMPKQAKGLIGWLQGLSRETQQKMTEAKEAKMKTDLEALKKEWGNGYEKELTAAKLAVKEIGGEDFGKYLEETGLGNDAGMIKFMAKAGKLLGEDRIRGATGGRMGMTPAEIDSKIGELTSDPAYADPSHGRHKFVVDQVSDLYKQKFSQ